MEWYTPLRNKMTALIGGQESIDQHVYREPAFKGVQKLKVFMWSHKDTEQIREDNWWWFEDVGVPEVFHIMDKILDYCAVIGIKDSGSEFDVLVLLDALYGMAVQAAIRNQQNEYKIEMPRIFGVGDSQSIQKLIRWRNYMGFAVDKLADHMLNDVRVGSLFVKEFGLQPAFAKNLLRRMYVAPNITMLYRDEEGSEVFFDPFVHRDCGYSGEAGWYRVQCLMQGLGYDIDLGIKTPDAFTVGVEVIHFLLSTYKNAVHEDVFEVLSEIAQYNTNTYVIGDR